MSNTKKIIIIFIFLGLLSGCGFKKTEQYQSLIHLQKISIDGDARISYKIKNNLQFISNKDAQNKYNITINLTQKKRDKIKNNTGRVTRYTITVNAELSLEDDANKETVVQSFSESANYYVASNHSETINNEKNAIKTIIQEISEKMKKFIMNAVRN